MAAERRCSRPRRAPGHAGLRAGAGRPGWPRPWPAARCSRSASVLAWEPPGRLVFSLAPGELPAGASHRGGGALRGRGRGDPGQRRASRACTEVPTESAARHGFPDARSCWPGWPNSGRPSFAPWATASRNGVAFLCSHVTVRAEESDHDRGQSRAAAPPPPGRPDGASFGFIFALALMNVDLVRDHDPGRCPT